MFFHCVRYEHFMVIGNNNAKRAVSGIKWTAFSLLFNIFVQIFQMSFFSRMLSPNEFGLIGVMVLVNTFAMMFLDMGIGKAIIQKQSVTQNELSSLYWLNCFIGIIIYIVILTFRGVIAQNFNHPDIGSLIMISSGIFLVLPFGQQYIVFLEKNLEFRTISLIEISSSGFQTLLSVILYYFGFGIFSIAFSMLFGCLLKVILFNLKGRKHSKVELYFRLSCTKSFLSFGLLHALDQIVGYINNNLSAIIIGKFIGLGILGGYNIANSISTNIPSTLNPVITRVLFPYLSLLQNNFDELIETFKDSLFYIGLINSLMLTSLYFSCPQIVSIIFGDTWLWIIPMIKILCVAGIFRALCNPSGVLLLAIGKVRFGLIFNAMKTFLFFIPLLYFSSKYYLINGVVFSLLGFQIINFIANGFIFKALLQFRFKDYLITCSKSVMYALPLAIILLAAEGIESFYHGALFILIIKIMLIVIYILSVGLFSRNKKIDYIRRIVYERTKA